MRERRKKDVIIAPSDLPQITRVSYHPEFDDFVIEIELNTGEVILRDFETFVSQAAGVLKKLKQKKTFSKVRLEGRAVAWGDIELDPYAIVWGGYPSEKDLDEGPCHFAEIGVGGTLTNCSE